MTVRAVRGPASAAVIGRPASPLANEHPKIPLYCRLLAANPSHLNVAATRHGEVTGGPGMKCLLLVPQSDTERLTLLAVVKPITALALSGAAMVLVSL
jgi:hypothetical protein